MRILVFEDEPPAVAQLEHALRRWDPGARVAAVAATVRRAVELLREGPEPDLVLADIRLADGLSLAAFDAVPVRCPVIFTTAYDTYLVQALERSAIDYVLKPIQVERVVAALEKYARLREHFADRLARLGAELGPRRDPAAAPGEAASPTRLLARQGASFIAVPLERVAWFTTEHKLTLLVDRAGARLVVDEPLDKLERRLDPRRFFRLNRQILAEASAVASFRSAGKGRLLVELTPPAPDEVLVSQENAPAFRAWIAT